MMDKKSAEDQVWSRWRRVNGQATHKLDLRVMLRDGERDVENARVNGGGSGRTLGQWDGWKGDYAWQGNVRRRIYLIFLSPTGYVLGAF